MSGFFNVVPLKRFTDSGEFLEAITNGTGTFLNNALAKFVQLSVTPETEGENCYKSKYWPSLNGLTDDFAFWAAPTELQTERESVLLDIIGAYDLLLLQGLSAGGAATRLGLRKSRDELVQELDAETARRLAVQLPTVLERPSPDIHLTE